LAGESEFNIETTSAIAGVRGTEFGIDENSDLIVLSGSVAAREKTHEELNIATGADQYLEFDSATDFTDLQIALGDGTFKRFAIPSVLGNMADGVDVSAYEENRIEEKFYTHKLGLSGADTPYIAKAQSNGDGTYTLHITFNSFIDEGSREIDGFEIFGNSQTRGFRKMKEGALDDPLMTVTEVPYSPSHKAYLFNIQYENQPDTSLYNEEKGRMESVIVRAFKDVGEIRTYSRISWPLTGFIPDNNKTKIYSYEIHQVHPEFFEKSEITEELVLTSIEIDDIGTILLDGEHQLKVEGHYNDMTSRLITNDCDWIIEDSKGTISDTGMYSASSVVEGDEINITCTYDNNGTPMTDTKKISIGSLPVYVPALELVVVQADTLPPYRIIEGSSITLSATAIYEDSTNQDITDDCVWTSSNTGLGMVSAGIFSSGTGVNGETNVSCSYEENAITKTDIVLVAVIDAVRATCWGTNMENDEGQGDDVGFWADAACWFLAEPDTDCDTACETVSLICKDQTNPGAANWFDADGTACMALTGKPLATDKQIKQYAPFFNKASNFCFERDPSMADFVPNLCGTNEGMAIFQQRVCRCI